MIGNIKNNSMRRKTADQAENRFASRRSSDRKKLAYAKKPPH